MEEAGPVLTPRLMAIVDRACAGSDAVWLERLGEILEAAPDDGSVWVQLRAKRVAGEARQRLFAAARERVARDRAAPVLVNGTGSDARAAGFAGVHWPEALRPAPSESAAAGLSTISAAVHDPLGAVHAAGAGAQVVVFAPVFDPGSKPTTGKGLGALQAVVRASPVPVIALGGIGPDRVQACLDSGAAGVAVLSAVSAPGVDAAAAISELLAVG